MKLIYTLSLAKSPKASQVFEKQQLFIFEQPTLKGTMPCERLKPFFQYQQNTIYLCIVQNYF